MPRLTRKRTIAAMVAAGAVVGASPFVGASPASASYPSPTIHYCGNLGGPIYSDDGAITDPIHHNVEPLVAPLNLQGAVHQVNCMVLSGALGL